MGNGREVLMFGGADRSLQLVRKPALLGGRDRRGQSFLDTGVLAGRGEDFSGGDPAR